MRLGWSIEESCVGVEMGSQRALADLSEVLFEKEQFPISLSVQLPYVHLKQLSKTFSHGTVSKVVVELYLTSHHSFLRSKILHMRISSSALVLELFLGSLVIRTLNIILHSGC